MRTRLIVRQRRLNPFEAELWVSVRAQPPISAADVAGRFVGPKCRFASTIEVSYPLQPLPSASEATADAVKRVVIHEPSLWTPETPFLYSAQIEHPHGRDQFNFGIRSLEMKPQGCWLNGQPFPFETSAADSLTEQQAIELRQSGINTLLVRSPVSWEILDVADRCGLFVIAELGDAALDDHSPRYPHPSLAGWLIPTMFLRTNPYTLPSLREALERGEHLGIRLESPPDEPLPDWLSFIVCPSSLRLSAPSAFSILL